MSTGITKRKQEYNNNEMNMLGRLSNHEARDGTFEDLHETLSKRGSLRKSLSSPRFNELSAATLTKEEEKEVSKVRRSKSSDRKSDRSKSKRSSDPEKEKSRSRRPSKDRGDNSHSNMIEERRRRRSDRKRNSRAENSDDSARPVRSASAIEKLLQYEAGDFSVGSTESNNEKKGSINPLLLGLSKSRDSGTGGKSVHNKSTSSRERKSKSRSASKTRKAPGRSKSESKAKKSSDPSSSTSKTKKLDTPDSRKKVRRRRSSSSQHDTSYRQKGRSGERPDGKTRYLAASKSMRLTRSYMPQNDLQQEKGITQDSFEKLWGKKMTSDGLDLTNTSHNSNSSSETDNDGIVSMGDYSGELGILSPGKAKKTKLEKIHELQGKCDIFKIELDAMAEERSKCMRDLHDSRGDVTSLKKTVDVHEEQSKKLKSKLLEVQDELELTRTEQRKERIELSEAAKDLARVNIDYAKSVDEARTVKEKLDGLQGALTEREEKIIVLEKDLEASKENVRQLEADVLYADEQIDKLEAEMKRMEKQVALYIEAADRDSRQHPNGDGDKPNHLREAKYEAEKLECEEREKEIVEKKRILDEERRVFERQKTRHLEEQQQREEEFEENRARAEQNRARKDEEIKMSDVDHMKKEEQVNERLRALEDENVALNGRLKSEKLDSTMKLQSKVSAITELEEEVARLTKEKKQRDSAPYSSPSLLLEIETLKTEAVKRKSEYDDVRMLKIDLENEIEALENKNIEMMTRLNSLESRTTEQKKEVENQRRKSLEWQKKTGEWSEKAVGWKQKSEHWEKKAKEVNNDASSNPSDDGTQAEPQALFLAAAVEKKAVSSATGSGSWRFTRNIFSMASENEDETHALIIKLEGENSLKENEIKILKSEMVKMQTSYKEQAYSKTQEFEKLQKEKEAIELNNTNLLKGLELARKLNQTISESSM